MILCRATDKCFLFQGFVVVRVASMKYGPKEAAHLAMYVAHTQIPEIYNTPVDIGSISH